MDTDVFCGFCREPRHGYPSGLSGLLSLLVRYQGLWEWQRFNTKGNQYDQFGAN